MTRRGARRWKEHCRRGRRPLLPLAAGTCPPHTALQALPELYFSTPPANTKLAGRASYGAGLRDRISAWQPPAPKTFAHTYCFLSLPSIQLLLSPLPTSCTHLYMPPCLLLSCLPSCLPLPATSCLLLPTSTNLPGFCGRVGAHMDLPELDGWGGRVGWLAERDSAAPRQRYVRLAAFLALKATRANTCRVNRAAHCYYACNCTARLSWHAAAGGIRHEHLQAAWRYLPACCKHSLWPRLWR